MWYEYVDKNRFLLNLYNSIPILANVGIHELKLSEEGDRLTLKFDMPQYADNPPKKWIEANYNRTIVELDFFCIKEICLNTVNRDYKGDIEISKQNDGFLHLDIHGNVQVHLIAEACLLQSVTGYFYE